MSEPLDGMIGDVYVDDRVVTLGDGGAHDVAGVHPPVVLHCKARLCVPVPPGDGDQACLRQS